MAQFHYVVVYDTERKEFYPDIDTEISRFPDGQYLLRRAGGSTLTIRNMTTKCTDAGYS